jgi:hypothetical protein
MINIANYTFGPFICTQVHTNILLLLFLIVAKINVPQVKCLTVGECQVAFDFGIVVPAKHVGFKYKTILKCIFIVWVFKRVFLSTCCYSPKGNYPLTYKNEKNQTSKIKL